MASRPPLTEDEYGARMRHVEDVIAQAIAAGKTTNLLCTVDHAHTLYAPQRAALHKEIVDFLLGEAAGVPSEGKAILAGGPMGAGKTTVLTGHARIGPSRWLVLTPDIVKEQMASRGMVPSMDGLSPMEAACLIHEESSWIARKLADEAYARRLNVIWDFYDVVGGIHAPAAGGPAGRGIPRRKGHLRRGPGRRVGAARPGPLPQGA